MDKRVTPEEAESILLEAAESLQSHFNEMDEILEADRIAHDLPEGQFRPLAQVLAELEAAE